jgi:hypothetical protein
MWDKIEKYFPEIVSFIKSISLLNRLLLAVIAGLFLFCLHALVKNKAYVFKIYDLEIQIVLLVLILFVILLSLLSLTYFSHYLRKRSSLVNFCLSWVQFTSFLFLFIPKVDSYLLHEKRTNCSKLDELMPEVEKYHTYRDQLRELLHSLKEPSLVVTKVYNWEEIKKKYKIFEERQYDTPFSFLLDFKNPIAFFNLHGKEAWEAMHVSNEFIEYLGYEHKFLKQKLNRA